MSTNASVGAPDHHGASGGSGRFSFQAVESILSGNSLADEACVGPRALGSNAYAPGAGNLGELNCRGDERGNANAGNKRPGVTKESELSG